MLDSFTANLAETTIGGSEIVLFNRAGSDVTLDVSPAAPKNLILSVDDGKTTIAAAASTITHTIGIGMEQFLLNGATVSSRINAKGVEVVQAGATAKADVIAGGTLDLEAGAKLADGVGFLTTTNGGTLVIESATLVSATISGFIQGDKIKLPGITYNSADTVTVATAGVVTIKTPGGNDNLNIAGATVGATSYSFGPGSVLTNSATGDAVMRFLPPAAEVARARGDGLMVTGAAAGIVRDLAPLLVEHRGVLDFAEGTPHSLGYLEMTLASHVGFEFLSFHQQPWV